MHDYTRANLDPPTRAMLDFAVKLTRQPWSMEEGDVRKLRDSGLSDEQVLSVVLIACAFNFMTRLADGLGVEFPPERLQVIEGWLREPARRQGWLMPDGA